MSPPAVAVRSGGLDNRHRSPEQGRRAEHLEGGITPQIGRAAVLWQSSNLRCFTPGGTGFGLKWDILYLSLVLFLYSLFYQMVGGRRAGTRERALVFTLVSPHFAVTRAALATC